MPSFVDVGAAVWEPYRVSENVDSGWTHARTDGRTDRDRFYVISGETTNK